MPKAIAWPLLFVLPIVASAAISIGRFSAFDFILPYVILLGGLSGWLEVRASKRIRSGGMGDIGLAVFRNICHTGFLVVAALIVGVAIGTIIANFGFDVSFSR